MDQRSFQRMRERLSPYDLNIFPLLNLLNASDPSDAAFQQVVENAAVKREKAWELQNKLAYADELMQKLESEMLSVVPFTRQAEHSRLERLYSDLKAVECSVYMNWIGAIVLLIIGFICMAKINGGPLFHLGFCAVTSICVGFVGGILGGICAIIGAIRVTMEKTKKQNKIEAEIRSLEGIISGDKQKVREEAQGIIDEFNAFIGGGYHG